MNLKTIQVTDGNVLIRIEKGNTTSDSGIVLARATDKQKALEAEAYRAVVVKSLSYKTGDIVYVSKWEVHHCMIDGEQLAVVNEKNVLLVISKHDGN